MNDLERKQRIKATFDAVCNGYDCLPLRFFNHAAAVLPETFDFRGHESVLDVAAGTGIPAMAIASGLPTGSVTAVDFSEGMLAQAAAKCEKAGLSNIRFLPMDMTAMDLPEREFDAVNCSFGLFFVEDMDGTLRHFVSKVKPGGSVVTTHFKAGSFGQLAELFGRRVEAYGLPVPPISWMRVATEEQNRALFNAAELTEVEVASYDVGYFLEGPEQWWDIIWNAGYRGLIATLEPDQLAKFKREHLEEVDALTTPDGLRLDVQVLVAKGTRR